MVLFLFNFTYLASQQYLISNYIAPASYIIMLVHINFMNGIIIVVDSKNSISLIMKHMVFNNFIMLMVCFENHHINVNYVLNKQVNMVMNMGIKEVVAIMNVIILLKVKHNMVQHFMNKMFIVEDIDTFHLVFVSFSLIFIFYFRFYLNIYNYLN